MDENRFQSDKAGLYRNDKNTMENLIMNFMIGTEPKGTKCNE